MNIAILGMLGIGTPEVVLFITCIVTIVLVISIIRLLPLKTASALTAQAEHS